MLCGAGVSWFGLVSKMRPLAVGRRRQACKLEATSLGVGSWLCPRLGDKTWATPPTSNSCVQQLRCCQGDKTRGRRRISPSLSISMLITKPKTHSVWLELCFLLVSLKSRVFTRAAVVTWTRRCLMLVLSPSRPAAHPHTQKQTHMLSLPPPSLRSAINSQHQPQRAVRNLHMGMLVRACEARSNRLS